MFEGIGQDENPTVVKLNLDKLSTFSLFPGQVRKKIRVQILIYFQR